MLELLRHGHGVESWAPTGDIARVVLGGQEIVVAVENNHEEVERRRRHRLGAISNRRSLQLLLSLPQGVAIPVTFLRESDLRALQAMPAGVVELNDGEVRVVVSPALRVSSVGVVAPTWKQGFRLASPYAAYCARYVVLARGQRPAEATMAALEARFYGVGLAELRDGALDWVVSPAAFDADRFTASSWLMAERLTAELHERAR